jgi:hypothetical protein
MKTSKRVSEGINIEDLKKTKDLKLPKKQRLVRTTLRLSKTGHEDIKKVSKLQGMRNAEVFETIIVLFEVFEKKIAKFSWTAHNKSETVRKTYVIKKDTLSKIMSISEEIKISKDLIIDKMAIFLSYIYDDELRKREKKYRDILKNTLEPFTERADEVKKQLIKELGKDDPVISGFDDAVFLLEKLEMTINEYIDKGTPIDHF